MENYDYNKFIRRIKRLIDIRIDYKTTGSSSYGTVNSNSQGWRGKGSVQWQSYVVSNIGGGNTVNSKNIIVGD